MMHSESRSGNWESRNRRNTVLLAWWTTAWVATLALAVFGPRFIWSENGVLTLLAILFNLAIGIGMILANKRHLQGLDELQKKIQLEAMALSLGIGLVGGLSYSTLDVTNLISSDAEISNLVILMAVTYLAGIVAGHRKYR